MPEFYGVGWLRKNYGPLRAVFSIGLEDTLSAGLAFSSTASVLQTSARNGIHSSFITKPQY